MRQLAIWVLLALLVVVPAAPAAAVPHGATAAEANRYCCLSKERICVDSTYTGDTVEVSGVAEPGAEVIVKVTSPPAEVRLARKGKVGPIWMNVSEVEFDHAPAFYQVNCTGTLNPVLSEEMMGSYGLGYEGLKTQMRVKPAAEDTKANFEEFIDLKESQGLYRLRPHDVRVDSQGIFHTAFRWPSNAPVGAYDVAVYEVRDGQVIRQAEGHLNMEKVGLTRWLANLAQQHGAEYGLLAVLSALGAGLIVGFIFKGSNGH